LILATRYELNLLSKRGISATIAVTVVISLALALPTA